MHPKRSSHPAQRNLHDDPPRITHVDCPEMSRILTHCRVVSNKIPMIAIDPVTETFNDPETRLRRVFNDTKLVSSKCR